MEYRQSSGILKFVDPQKGWGVFADREIRAGDIVEIAPVLRLSQVITDKHVNLKSRVFDWGALGGGAGETALVLGYGSMYNHANPANVRYSAIHDGMSSALVFTAARDVSLGEELTINYNYTKGDVVSSRDNWFEGHGVAPLP